MKHKYKIFELLAYIPIIGIIYALLFQKQMNKALENKSFFIATIIVQSIAIDTILIVLIFKLL
jgi:hypothetical protein